MSTNFTGTTASETAVVGRRRLDGPLNTPPRVWITPVVVLAASTGGWLLATLSVRRSLPDPVATHWSNGPHPDGFSSVTADLIVSTLLTLFFPLLMLGLGAALKTLRPMAAVCAGLGVGMATLLFGDTIAQRGLADAHQANSPDRLMVLATVVGLVVAGLTWLVVRPRDRVHAGAAALPASAHTIEVPRGARVAWTGTTASSVGTRIAQVVSLSPPVVMAIVFGVQGADAASVVMVVLVACLGALLMTMLHSRVTIDQRGVRAAGLGLVRWVQVPLDTIESAEGTCVTAMGEFGGWGLRTALDGSGSRGLITASGPALRIHRAGQGDFVITLSDADRAAAVLNTLVERRAGGAR